MDATQTKDILIIDIDPESQKAFNRFFVEKGYKPRYAKDEQTAITAINSKPFALIIIDILTSGLSGLKSLQNIVVNAKRKNTQTVVVTKYSKTEVVSKCVGIGATDYIVKPIENVSFTQRIGKLIKLPEPERKADEPPKPASSLINELVEKLKNDDLDFSVMPQLGYKIIELLEDDKTPLNKVTDLIEKDPGIFSRILKAANSPVYAAGKPVYNAKESILRIGIKRTINYVLVISSARLFSSPDKTYEDLLKTILEHGLTAAIVARELGNTINYPNPENLFAFGLLHDIGKVLLLRILKDVSEERNIKDPAVITELLEKLHTRFGASLIQKWNFPKEFYEAILYHHDDPDRGRHKPQVVITSLANIIAHEIENGTLKTNTASIIKRPHLGLLGIKMNNFDPYRIAVQKEIEVFKNLLD